jgi:hypothetical protein
MRVSLAILLALTFASCSRDESLAVGTPDSPIDAPVSVEQAPVDTRPVPPAVVLLPLAFGIARYPGAEQLGDAPDFLAENKDQNARWLQFETPDAPEKVIAFYKAEAEKASFTITEETEKKLAKSMQIKAERPQTGSLKVNTMVQKDGNTFINVHTADDL